VKTENPPRGLFKRKDGKWAMERCPKCHKENYAFNVMNGVCTWCGYDANAERSKGGSNG